MLRLTTNVTVSPASSARSSSAAWRMSSIASGRVSANSAVSSSASSAPPARARAIVSGAQRALRPVRPARAAPRDEAPEARLDHVEHALRDPLRVDVPRVDAQPLGQRHPVRREPLAHLVRRRERVLGRDVVAVGAQPAEVGRARRRRAAATSPRGSAGPGCRRPGISRRASPTSRSMSSTVTGVDHAGAQHRRDSVQAGAPVALRRLRGDLRRLLAVVAAVRDEVLEDDLLQVPELAAAPAPRAPPCGPPRSRRSRRGCRS